MLMKNGFALGNGEMFDTANQKFNQFWEIYKQLSPPFQNYILNCAKDLLKTQKVLD